MQGQGLGASSDSGEEQIQKQAHANVRPSSGLNQMQVQARLELGEDPSQIQCQGLLVVEIHSQANSKLGLNSNPNSKPSQVSVEVKCSRQGQG